MARLKATFDYSVRRLIVDSGLLGASLPLLYEGHQVELTFPVRSTQPESIQDEATDPSLFPPDDPPIPLKGGYMKLGFDFPPSDDWASIGVLRLHVYGEADPGGEELADVLRAWGDLADAIVQRLVEWLRIGARHHWLALGGERPEAIGTATIDDLDAYERLPTRISRKSVILHKVGSSEIVRPDVIQALIERVQDGDEPPLADSLLADALFYLDAEPPDPARAVLTAGIACEVKVRDILRARAEPVVAELLDVLLSNPRDWSLAAASLFHKPMRAVAGKSLADKGAIPPLKDVEQLFKLRNEVAHRGKRPTESEASSALRTAVLAFRWLNG